MAKIAIVQKAPAVLNKEKTITIAVDAIAEAAAADAELVVFSESFIAGYPAWIWRLRPGADWGLNEEIHKRFLKNTVELDSDDLNPLYKAAQKHNMTVVCGLNERDNQFSQAMLFNTVVVIDPDGKLLNRHRKLMPTNPERMVWGMGDATGLKTVDSPVGRLGSLICWENYMPLARYALYSQGVEVYIAPTYDSGDNWIGTLQHISREGRCWVVGCGNLLRGSDIPADFPERSTLYPNDDEWVNSGDSVVIAPGGEIVAGPLHQQDGILYCDIDHDRAAEAKRAMDVVGHYSRPDIFTLSINTKPQSPVKFER